MQIDSHFLLHEHKHYASTTSQATKLHSAPKNLHLGEPVTFPVTQNLQKLNSHQCHNVIEHTTNYHYHKALCGSNKM